jgi:hypothetical protein
MFLQFGYAGALRPGVSLILAGCLMRCALLKLGLVLLLIAPTMAQMRSTISTGPIHGGPPHPPGVTFRQNFGHHSHRGNGFGNVVYPYGFYDDFYDEPYRDVVEQPAPVVVVRDAQPAAAPAPAIQPAAVEPRMIEIPEAIAVRSMPIAKAVPAVFIFSDGRRIEAQNYTITDSLLTIKDARRPAVQIPLDQLNVEATLAENHQQGLDLRLPESRSEILIGF